MGPNDGRATHSSTYHHKPVFLVFKLLGLGVLIASLVAVFMINNQLKSVKTELSNIASKMTVKGSDVDDTIKPGEFQAVFLNSGQVYFGKLSLLNTDYVKITDVFYLQSGGSSSSLQSAGTSSDSNVSLVKLGCELHAPEDSMTISRSEITFWENLKANGQVVKSITQFEHQNPDGQTCTT